MPSLYRLEQQSPPPSFCRFPVLSPAAFALYARGMDNEPRTPDELRRENAECRGAPKHFTYPAAALITEEERRRYEEISAKLPTAKKRKRSRRR
jgi:hypothetical protein